MMTLYEYLLTKHTFCLYLVFPDTGLNVIDGYKHRSSELPFSAAAAILVVGDFTYWLIFSLFPISYSLESDRMYEEGTRTAFFEVGFWVRRRVYVIY